jgi:hypothetical protein
MPKAPALQAQMQPKAAEPPHAAPAIPKLAPQMHAQFKPAEAPRAAAAPRPSPAPHEMHASAAPHAQPVPPQAKRQDGGRDHDKRDPHEHHG